jgi:DNA repair exonuclease SbcCD nuclease subunit
MKILLTSDCHIAAHKKSEQRLTDTINALKWIFQTAHERQIKHVIIAGDLFQDRAKIDIAAYHYTFDIFLEFGKNLEIYLLLGNHDLLHRLKCDITSVRPLSALSGVYVIGEPSTLLIGGYPISFLPYTIDPAKDLKTIKNNSDFKLLIGHLAISGAKMNSLYHISDIVIEHDNEMTIVNTEVFDGWDQVFLGHYHQGQCITNNVEYIGSPLELNFGEANQQKHIIVFDMETHEKEYVVNEFSPKHLILEPEEIDVYDLNGHFIRLEVDNLSAVELVEIRRKILDNYKVGSFSINKKQRNKDEDQQLMTQAISHIIKHSEVIEEWIKHQKELGETEGLDENLLIEWGKKLQQKVEK